MLVGSAAATALTSKSTSLKDTAERRQVTVMFSDLVGSTALSARMDPEDLRDVITAYQKCVAEIVNRFDGFVAKYMGDGVLVYFGYPEAHEDDPERAVRAGLELVTAVRSLKAEVALQTRVGIATGLVVIGDLIGTGASQEQAVVGKTPNLAARLQGVAEPDMVVIAESTRRLLGDLFELDDLGTKNLKGIDEPVLAWAAVRPSSVESRFEAFHASGLTDLVGRQEELDVLMRRWSNVLNGQGQVVLLSGEAGIGKSRLTAALVNRLATEPHARLRYFCSPRHTDSAFYPIIGQMERAAGWTTSSSSGCGDRSNTNASSSMPSRPAARQQPGSDVGSATTTPIDPTRSSAAGRPMRSMLRRQTRRNWRRNRTQIPLSQAAILFRNTGPPLRSRRRSRSGEVTEDCAKNGDARILNDHRNVGGLGAAFKR